MFIFVHFVSIIIQNISMKYNSSIHLKLEFGIEEIKNLVLQNKCESLKSILGTD